MSDLYRDEWECCEVLNGGAGPEHRPWEIVLAVGKCRAFDAAKIFAEDLMRQGFKTNDWEDGDPLLVAVKIDEGRTLFFDCTCRVTVHADATMSPRNLVLAP